MGLSGSTSGAAGSSLLASSQRAAPDTSMQHASSGAIPAPPYYGGSGDHAALQALASAAVDQPDSYSGFGEGSVMNGIARFPGLSREMDIEGVDGARLGLVSGPSIGSSSRMEGMTPEDPRNRWELPLCIACLPLLTIDNSAARARKSVQLRSFRLCRLRLFVTSSSTSTSTRLSTLPSPCS